MASTPIIRYYDHLRLVYEVESRMRELRRNTRSQGEGGRDQQQQNPAADRARRIQADTRHAKDGGSRVDPPQQSGKPGTSNRARA